MAVVTSSCGRCLDGLCGYCTHGWPAEPQCDDCHVVDQTITTLLCPRCGNGTGRTRIITNRSTHSVSDRFVVEWCSKCDWERQVMP